MSFSPYRTIMLTLMIVFYFAALTPASAAEWTLQLQSGSGYSLDSELKIHQDGYEPLEFTAEYETKAFSTQAYYYNIKLGRWENGRAWELETLHHKLYLKNRPAEVQKFAISHGYNLNTVNRAWHTPYWGLIARVGLGFVMTHPETEIRGMAYEDEGGVNGFHISGFTVQAALEKRFKINERFFLSTEVKATASWAEIPIAEGHAHVPNYAIHGLLGIGVNF